jgi:hypothetical protein
MCPPFTHLPKGFWNIASLLRFLGRISRKPGWVPGFRPVELGGSSVDNTFEARITGLFAVLAEIGG